VLITSVYSDQSPDGAAKRAHFHLPDEAAELMKGRFRIIKSVVSPSI
jgi:hypothetical protein